MVVDVQRRTPSRASVPWSGEARRVLAVDAVIAVGLFAYSVVTALSFPPPPPYGWPGFLAVLAVAVLPLAGRRTWPGAAHTVITVGLTAAALLRMHGAGGNATVIALMISTYSFSAYARTSRPWMAWPMAVAPLLVVTLVRGGTSNYLFPILVVEMGMGWFFGSVQRQRSEVAALLDHRALQLEADPEEAERLAVAHERGRIARDLQALVAAAIDAMVAGAREARAHRGRDAEAAGRTAARLAETGREALQEMRRLLDVLRGRGPEPQDGAPTLAALPTLIARGRDAGVAVECSISGDPGAVAVAGQRAAYRLVEEALAMVAGRDGHGPLSVDIAVAGPQLRVSATWRSGGVAPPAPLAPFEPGLVALHERVALLGGHLRTRLAEDGGFALKARLPGPDAAADVRMRPEPGSSHGAGAAPGDTRDVGRGRAVVPEGIRGRPWLQDLLLAATLGTVALGEVLWFPEPLYEAERSWRAVVAVYLIAATLMLRRRAPVTALLAAGVLELGHDLLSLRWTNVMLLIFSIHIFTVASRRSRRTAVAAVLIAIASHAIFLTRVVAGAFSSGWLGIPATAAATIVLAIGLRILGMWIFAAFAGRTLASREELNGRLADRIRRLMEHRDVQAYLAVADERRRIARELHDVVGHGLSVMVLQAGAAATLLGRDPARADDLLGSIEQLGSQAHQELDTLVELLGPDAGAVTGPPRTIEQLVADARDAGLDIDLSTEGHGDAGGPLGLHAYRIVQEALTNAGKHASGARVSVRLAFLDGAVEIEVVNEPAPTVRVGGAGVPGAGHGLIGMRERVGLFGGELTAGPRPDGGFAVLARLPQPVPT